MPKERVKPVTVNDVLGFKKRGYSFPTLSLYDYAFAKIANEARIPLLLVGDSLGMVALGRPNTLSVTMEEMITSCAAVARGSEYSLVVGDMPFMSYQSSPTDAVINAGRLVAEGGVQGVKLEGGKERVKTVEMIVSSGIPVMGHIGYLPQSVHHFNRFEIRGKVGQEREQQSLLEDAVELEKAGAFAVVLELVDEGLAKEISESLNIPTIGIGSGTNTDGQILVIHDLLGLSPRVPKHLEPFALNSLRPQVLTTLAQFQEKCVSGVWDGER